MTKHNPFHFFLTIFSLSVLLTLSGCGEDRVQTKVEKEKIPEAMLKYGLHEAAKTGDLEAVQAFIEKGAPLNSTDNFEGKTPLIFAARQGHPKVVEALPTSAICR